MVRRFVPLVLLFVIAVRLSATSADVTRTVGGFLEAWSAGDVAAARRSWVEPAPASFHRYVLRPLTVSCIDLHDVRLSNVRVDGGRAWADVELLVTKRSALPAAKPRHGTVRATLRLAFAGGAWRIDEWRDRDEQLADELLAQPSRAARSEWLERHAQDWTPELLRVLGARVVLLYSSAQGPMASELVDHIDRVAGDLGDDASRAVALTAASARQRAGAPPDFARAAEFAAKAVELAERSTDPDVLADALLRLGKAPPNVADREIFRRVLSLAGAVEDPIVLALTASSLATQDQMLGEYRSALANVALAAQHAESAGSTYALLQAEMTFGNVYAALGDPELAALHYERAAALSKQGGLVRNYLAFVRQMVSAQLAAGRAPAELLRTVEEALALPGLQGNVPAMINLLAARGRLHMKLGDLAQAEADIVEALALDRENRIAYETLSELRMLQGRYADAKTAIELGYEVWSVTTWARYVEATRGIGEIDEAILIAHCAIEHTEAAFERTTSERNRQTYLANRYEIEQILVELLVQRGRVHEALRVAEAAKARVLRDAAGRTRREVEEASPEAELEQKVLVRMEGLNRALLSEKDEKRLAELHTARTRARLELHDVRVRAASRVRGHELYAEAGIGRRGLRWPFEGVAAVQYMTGKRQTVIFVVTAGTDGQPLIRVETVPVDRDELQNLVAQLRSRIAVRDLRYGAPARRLYDLLIAPVQRLTASSKTLCFIPDGDLWKVPFQALQDARGRALIETKGVFYAPSMQMLTHVHERKPRTREPRLLALGNPSVGSSTAARFRAHDRATILGNLVEAETEVREIVRLYGGTARNAVYIRGEAREALFKKEAPRYDVVHVAAHGLVDDASPTFSSVVLAATGDDGEDGLLEAHEVARMELNAELVVLSACDTASGRIGGGEGILGLSWAFLAAGADGLVGSQWKAPSAATMKLMVAFHERLIAGDRPAEALRSAQRRLLRDERYASPLDWAPFIIVGDGL